LKHRSVPIENGAVLTLVFGYDDILKFTISFLNDNSLITNQKSPPTSRKHNSSLKTDLSQEFSLTLPVGAQSLTLEAKQNDSQISTSLQSPSLDSSLNGYSLTNQRNDEFSDSSIELNNNNYHDDNNENVSAISEESDYVGEYDSSLDNEHEKQGLTFENSSQDIKEENNNKKEKNKKMQATKKISRTSQKKIANSQTTDSQDATSSSLNVKKRSYQYPYGAYAKKRRVELKAEFQNLAPKQITELIKNEWRSLKDDGKSSFQLITTPALDYAAEDNVNDSDETNDSDYTESPPKRVLRKRKT